MKKQKAKAVTFRLAVVVSLITTALASCSEIEFNPNLTRKFSIESASSGAIYEITVGLPANYGQSGDEYSTIYVLDAEDNFDLVATKCEEISSKTGVQNVIVVSIGYGRDRSIDYTPTKVSSVTGGGLEFMQFIETQLILRIEQDFNVNTTPAGRVIIGHSYGGLFGACVLAVNNSLFGNYILLSPSIWFDNEVTLQLEKANRVNNQNTPQLVFLGIGEMENAGRMQAPFDAFYQILSDNYTNIKLSKNREPKLSHIASKDPNTIKGLTFYFQNRQF
jgi:predicted alpha/beta superfamily hydrolase